MLDMDTTKPILIAYDGSDGAKAAIEVAGRLFPGHRAVVLSVGHSLSAAFPSSLLGVSGGQPRAMYDHLEREAEQQAADIAAEGVAAAEEVGLQATGRSVLCLGQTWPVITEVADANDVAAIIVGSRGLSPIRSALLAVSPMASCTTPIGRSSWHPPLKSRPATGSVSARSTWRTMGYRSTASA